MKTLRIRKRPNLNLYLYREFVDGKPIKEESKASLKSLQRWFDLTDEAIKECEELKDREQLTFCLEAGSNIETLEAFDEIPLTSISDADDLQENILEDVYDEKTFDELSSEEKIKSLQEEIVKLNTQMETMRFEFEKKLNHIGKKNLKFAQEKNKIIFNVQVTLKKFKSDPEVKKLLKFLSFEV